MPADGNHKRDQLDLNKLSLGLFGLNCSGGLAVTTVPERWEASWENNLNAARMADEAGLDFMLPLGRWKGYGGITDHNASNFETLTWASGILASTRNLMVFRDGPRLAVQSSCSREADGDCRSHRAGPVWHQHRLRLEQR